VVSGNAVKAFDGNESRGFKIYGSMAAELTITLGPFNLPPTAILDLDLPTYDHLFISLDAWMKSVRRFAVDSRWNTVSRRRRRTPGIRVCRDKPVWNRE